MEKPVVEVLYDGKAQVGEGPIYDHVSGELIWVDIFQQTVNFLNVETKQNRSLTLPSTVGAAIPVEGSSDQLVVMVGKKICLINRHTGDLKELVEVDEDKPYNRFNDAKCDPSGRLWAGTMVHNNSPVPREEQGSLYSYSHGVLKKRLSGVTISNGMGWSPDESTMYWVDSRPATVFAFDYSDKGEGEIGNQRVLVDYLPDQERLGKPDGMTVDMDGNLWVASFFCQHGITCWDPTGQKLREVTIPAHACTSCCFGGPNYDLLFVTSCSVFTTEAKWKEFPHSGAVFVVKNLGTRGRPDNFFRL